MTWGPPYDFAPGLLFARSITARQAYITDYSLLNFSKTAKH